VNRPGDEQLDLDEFVRRTSAPIEGRELEEARALCSWFVRRYPTVRERLAYARRKYREWTQFSGTRAPDV
jgi:hypothetical protein